MSHSLETTTIPAISFDNYGYRYPHSSRPSLKGIDIRVEQHTTTAIMGDSGSGKSTLVNAATGFIPQFYRDGIVEGSAQLMGQDNSSVDIFHLSRQYTAVFQNFGSQLLAADTASAVAFSLENQGLPRDEIHQRVVSALETVGITHLADRQVSTLSGGERQLAAIAAALTKKAPIIFLDDPTSDLDVRAQRQVQNIVNILQQQGTTIVLVDSMSPQWLQSVSSQIIFLDNGRCLFAGSPSDLSKNPSLTTDTEIAFSRSEFRPPHNSPMAIQTNNLTFYHSGSSTPALADVSAGIYEGSITGIIGPNGSGKTTLSKLLGGIYKPKSGTVDLKGSSPHRLPATNLIRQIAYVQQDAASAAITTSVEAELAYPFKNSQIQPEDIGLKGLEKEHPNDLPTGQKQMLAVGCALSHGARVVICDEPTNGLNQTERRRLTELMTRFQQKGITFVLVSHDLGLIARTTNNLIVMNQGRVVASGPTSEIMVDTDIFDRINLPPLFINN